MRHHTEPSSLSGLSANDLLARTSSAHRNKDFFIQLVTSCQSNNQSPSESCMRCWLQTDAPTPPVDPSSDENSPRSVPRADLSVGLGGAGGDGAAEEGAHRGPEGDEEAAGKIVLPRALPSATPPPLPVCCFCAHCGRVDPHVCAIFCRLAVHPAGESLTIRSN